MIKKILITIDFIFYETFLMHIPFEPGKYLRYLYFKMKMGKHIGKEVIIGRRVSFGNTSLASLGDNVTLTSDVRVGYGTGGKVIIKKNSLIGEGTLFINNMHKYMDRNKAISEQGYEKPFKDTIIEEHVWIGARVILMPGVRIGKNSVIGAGAVVTKNIPANSIAVGVPAKVIKNIHNL